MITRTAVAGWSVALISFCLFLGAWDYARQWQSRALAAESRASTAQFYLDGANRDLDRFRAQQTRLMAYIQQRQRGGP